MEPPAGGRRRPRGHAGARPGATGRRRRGIYDRGRDGIRLAKFCNFLQLFCNFLVGSFSAQRNFARKYAFDSIFQVLQDLHTWARERARQKFAKIFKKFPNLPNLNFANFAVPRSLRGTSRTHGAQVGYAAVLMEADDGRGLVHYRGVIRSVIRSDPRGDPIGKTVQVTLRGSFAAVSKPNFASKYAFESSRRDLHNALLCTALQSHFFLRIC